MTTSSDQSAGERSSRSIREVLELLSVEFPDVTVSKIRFLESRGLIHPERTAAGYRKFGEEDVERLRWILRQQRENFLPLKVIKGRLERGEAPPPPSLFDEASSEDQADSEPEEGASPEADDEGAYDPFAGRDDERAEGAGEEQPAKAPGAKPPKPRARRPEGQKKTQPPRRRGGLSAGELAKAASADVRIVGELDEFGLLEAEGEGEDRLYRESCVEIVRIARALRNFGIEGRHLRTFKHAAEREAGLFSQVVAPQLRQRSPEALRRARTDLTRLVELGKALHEAFVSAALGDLGRG